MKNEYDFSKAKKNPYVKKLKKQLTIRLDKDTIEYFKNLGEDKDISYQTLINLYLRDCAQNHKKLQLNWSARKAQSPLIKKGHKLN
ncbi:MAG: antitoxin [Gammaproteobacteria bacterium]|nr:antitoxin [Gammaproteobacteria bacterium]